MGAKVRTLLRGRVLPEGGDPFGPSWRPDRVAVMAHWSAGPRLSRSVTTYVRQLRSAGFDVVLVSACESAEPLEWPGGRPDGVLVLRKPNLGYDFGSWSVALELYPGIAAADHVLLTNDSLVGPFADIGWILDNFLRTPADMWGLTDNDQFGHHLQSFLVGFRRGLLDQPVMRRFWAGVRVEDDKMKIVLRYEIRLSRLVRRWGFTQLVVIPATMVCKAGENPVIKGWRELLRLGVPFVKRQILTEPEVAPHGDRVGATVTELYGQDVWAWV